MKRPAKSVYRLGTTLKRWIEYHPIWVVLTIAAFLMGIIISANTITTLWVGFYREHVGWKHVEQTKIDQLAPTETLDYFNSVLGQPVIKQHNPHAITKLDEYIYRRKGYWVTAYVNSNRIVDTLAITACGEAGFYPTIYNNAVGGPIVLDKTTMKQAITPLIIGEPTNNLSGYDPRYYVAGATAPSYFYDEYYLGNPSRYQTVDVGNNSICGEIKIPQSLTDKIDSKTGPASLTTAEKDDLRNHVLVNTFVVNSPVSEEDILKDSGTFGVSYIDAEIISPPKPIEYKTLMKRDANYKNLPDYSVGNIKY